MNHAADDILNAISAANADLSPLLEEMTAYGRENNFPIVGPETGQFLRTLAVATGARRVFEFGSGFGYSAAWYASVLPDDGEIVLTDFEEKNLERAESYLKRADFTGKIYYEVGDAMESFEQHDGPWDLVLVDHQKSEYANALSLARPELTENAVIVADNILRGPVSPSDLRGGLHGEATELDENAAGIIEYVRTVRDDETFETSIVPLGSGLAVSVYRV
ncbi:hypothetical protein Harman_41480 [Haloarcula mannanilytica]|uniref:Caffeoyl-CoA O-methyltransferase n=1 Tax=Haloarcula mannanilytica TaxID=2509225 RepID=A0A4C2EU98_9EURY|nr:O-methyltransferase [Haloarcula mannanilytica]GCF16213.1 hypothetical protein Harman_41480 [Haloarcula mannanilytica]